MNSALEAYHTQLISIDQDLPGLVRTLSDEQFNWSPASGRWSIGQCVEHLNITMEKYLPVLRQAMSSARSRGLLSAGPFALGFVERWFMRSMEPPPQRRIRTPTAFEAPQALQVGHTLERFLALQDGFRGCIREADGLDLRAVKVKSQFGPISWSLNGTLAILLAHERRHIWQAREVRNDPGFPKAPAVPGV